MKFSHLLLTVALLGVLPACERKPTMSEKVSDKVDDALDRRPGEKVRDPAEDARGAVEDAAKDVKNAVKDAAK